VQKTQEDVRLENLKKKQMMAEDDVEVGGDDENEDDAFFARAKALAAAKSLNQGGDFTAQFVGNGKLNPAAEAAIIEQNKREERLKEERAEKERKAARKAEKKKAQNGGWFDEGSAPKPAKKNW